MIQSPQIQYIPQQVVPSSNNPIPMQVPSQQTAQPQSGVIYNYPSTSSYYPANSVANGKSQYNGVNIEIINPQGVGSTPQAGYQVPAQYIPAQYVLPGQFVPQQPGPVVPQMEQPLPQPAAQTPIINQTPAVQVPQPQIAPAAQDISAEQAPNNIPAQQTPEIQPPAAPDSSITPESFAAKLKTDDLDAQKTTIEDIAEIVKNNQEAGPVLLDTQIFDELVNIINKDNSALEAPSPEVLALREKKEEEMTEEEKAKALTPSPLEKAEMNKQYALYTISYMQERLNNELEKRNGQALALKDLPCIDTVIDAVKSNENPKIREGAIAALSNISRPEYEKDLKIIFELAKSDQDPNVTEAASKALDLLSGTSSETPETEAKEAAETKEQQNTAEEAPKSEKKGKKNK